MTGGLLRTRHAESVLARQSTAESSWLEVPDARSSRTHTSTRRPKPGKEDTRGCGRSSRDVDGETFLTACSNRGASAGPPRPAAQVAGVAPRA